MGSFTIFEEVETPKVPKTTINSPVIKKPSKHDKENNASILQDKQHFKKSSSAPSKLNTCSNVRVNPHRQALADAAALPPKKQNALLKRTNVKMTENLSIEDVRKARRAERLRKQTVLGDVTGGYVSSIVSVNVLSRKILLTNTFLE